MNKGRMEAFSDGVIAILITIMVFDIKAPKGSDFTALTSVVPVALSYAMSFLYLAIYWNNHHHMLQMARRITGASLWANLHLLFWLSLLPFATSWLHSSGFSNLPTAVYGMVLLLAALAYYVLQTSLIRAEGSGSCLRDAIGADVKGKLSPVFYVLGIVVAFPRPELSIILYVLVALIWLVPDQRIESRFAARTGSSQSCGPEPPRAEQGPPVS